MRESERENDLWFPKISIVPVSCNSFNILIVSTEFESESSTGTFQNFSLTKTKNDDIDANDFFVFHSHSHLFNKVAIHTTYMYT